MGTLDYVAPEQIRGEAVDARADVYALGGVLHFVLTGRVPFARDADEAKLWAQLSEPPPRPSAAGAPVAFDAVVARAIDKAPQARFPSAGDLAHAAGAALIGVAPTRPERMVARGDAAPHAEVSTVTTLRPPRRRRWLLPAAVVVLGGGLAAVLLLPHGGPPPPARRPHVGARFAHVGQRPNELLLAGGRLWVGSFGADRLARLDPRTGRQLATVAIGRGLVGLLAAGGEVVAAMGPSHRLLHIDATTGRIVARVPTTVRPMRVAAGPDGVWVLGQGATGDGTRIEHFDVAARRSLGTIGLHQRAATLAELGGHLWTATSRSPAIVRIDPRSGGAQDVWVRLPGLASSLRATGGALWAALTDQNLVARIDPATPNFVDAGGGLRPEQVLVAGGLAFVARRDDHTVRVLDPHSGDAVHAPIKVGLDPYGLAGDARSLWVAGLADDTVTRIDHP